MTAISFAWPWCFLVLPLPWLLRRRLAPHSGVALMVPSLPALPMAGARKSASSWLAIAAWATWVLLVTAAARPQAPGELIARQAGRDLMLAFDVSGSMATRDMRVGEQTAQRLDVARRLADTFIRQRDGDRIGLIVFGSQAYLHTPLTFDLDAVRAALGMAEAGLAGRETALGDAIALATKHLGGLADGPRTLVILSDGSNTAGTLAPLRAAWLAQRANVRVHAVGIGAAAELDEATLRGIAEQTGGIYLRAADEAALAAFFRRIGQLEPAVRAASSSRRAHELYVWPLGMAFMLACWLVVRRAKRASKGDRA